MSSGYIGTPPAAVPRATRTLKDGTLSSETDTINVSYQPGHVQVYIDGMLLPEDSYTAVSGNDIVLDTTYPSGTQYIVEQFKSFEVTPSGFSGTFTNGDGNTVTVEGGIITDVSS